MNTIVIVDDDDRFRAQATAVLEADGFVVIGEASGGERGLAAIRDLEPDIVLIDIGLPDIDGFEVARTVGGESDAKVVLMSTREASAYGPRMLAGSWVGFIPKEELSGEAIRKLVGLR